VWLRVNNSKGDTCFLLRLIWNVKRIVIFNVNGEIYVNIVARFVIGSIVVEAHVLSRLEAELKSITMDVTLFGLLCSGDLFL
jgi:hypothetical protein